MRAISPSFILSVFSAVAAAALRSMSGVMRSFLNSLTSDTSSFASDTECTWDAYHVSVSESPSRALSMTIIFVPLSAVTPDNPPRVLPT